MAMTLSRLMAKSARMMVRIAASTEVPPVMLPCASSCGASSLTPIQTSSRQPRALRNGMSSRTSAKAISSTRSSTAPAVPHRMPLMRCRCGRLRQASAITTALSPPSRMSIRTIWNMAPQWNVSMASTISSPPKGRWSAASTRPAGRSLERHAPADSRQGGGRIGQYR
ncbi:Uncharacterised protein [Bordetella pertussis]|nr:Uncharacterised protein [Bordetella pertussis]